MSFNRLLDRMIILSTFKMTFSALSELVANMTSVITLRGSKAYEVLQGVKETSHLTLNLNTLVCKVQRLTFNQRLMQYTHLPDDEVTFVAFYGPLTYHPRILFTRPLHSDDQDRDATPSKVVKQTLAPNKLIKVTGPAEYKILLNRLDVKHEAYVVMIYHEAGQPEPKTSLTELIEFQEAVNRPCAELTNTITELEDALDHLDTTIEGFSNESMEDLKSDLIYNLDSTLDSTLDTTQSPYDVDF